MQTENTANPPAEGAPVERPAAAEQAPRSGFDHHHIITSFRQWWNAEVTGTVNQSAVIAKRRAECELTARYLLMISMAAGIAILGLLLSSPAVVIGAMLLSPLMDPIMGVGFALAVGDYAWLRRSARTLAIGSGFAVVVFFSPLQTVTAEIAARTRPNLFDLLVAIFSAIAGAYSMIRGREGTIVGVAIATALMPPLAVVGYGLATFNWTVFSGALVLFITNLTAIALTATAMARIYGFSTNLSDKQTQMQAFLIFAAFVVLAIPLFLALRQIVWESNASRQARSVVLEVFDDRARVSALDPDYEAVPIQITATVLTPQIIADAEARTARAMTRRLGQDVQVSLTQVRVGTSAQAAEEAQLANAREREAAAQAQADEIGERLALLAGVPEAEVTVDRQRRRATVRARPLDGATLAAYAELERRINSSEPEWDIRFVPPALALPAIAFEEGEISGIGQRSLALAIWAQQRTGLHVRISGRADAAEAVRAAMAEKGITVEVTEEGSGFGEVWLSWVVG